MATGDIYLDGERVDFNGDPPTSVAAVWTLVADYLSDQERLVESIKVDESPWDPDTDENREKWGRLDLTTITLEEKLVGMALEWKSRRMETCGRLSALAGEVLRRGWSEVQGEVYAVFEALRPLVEQYGALATFGEAKQKPWAEMLLALYGTFTEALGATSNAVESEDCVVLSDLLDGELADSVESLIADVVQAIEEERKFEFE